MMAVARKVTVLALYSCARSILAFPMMLTALPASSMPMIANRNHGQAREDDVCFRGSNASAARLAVRSYREKERP